MGRALDGASGHLGCRQGSATDHLSDPCGITSSPRPRSPLLQSETVAPPLTAAGCDALVSAVSTVLVTVTEPALGDAHVGARAGEGVGAACLAFCGGNREPLRDAGAGGAGPGSWGDVPTAVLSPGGVRGGLCPSRGHLPSQTPGPSHHSERPRPSRPRSHRCRHTATAWRCSDGSGTQTGPLSRTCLGQSEATVRWGRDGGSPSWADRCQRTDGRDTHGTLCVGLSRGWRDGPRLRA